MSRVLAPLRILLLGLFVLSPFLLGVALPSQANAETGAEIDANVTVALDRFLGNHGSAQALMDKAAGVLVFPNVVKAGFGFGAEYGEGALQVAGKTVDYYNTVAASFGFQLGLQMRSVILMFMTEPALANFRASYGWEAGVDGSVALVTIGAGATLDTSNIRSPIVGFITDQKGLMYNLTLEGSKMTRIER